MKRQTFRIGADDYQVTEYVGSHKVKFSKIPREGEVQEKGTDYDSVEAGIESIVGSFIEGYKIHILSIDEARVQCEKAWRVDLAQAVGSKKAGYVVIISKKEQDELTYQDYDFVKYCRGVKATEEVSIDVMKPKVTETTNYDASQMFHLNHGMSWERYMST